MCPKLCMAMLAVVALSGCQSQSSIQAKYSAAQTLCRAAVETPLLDTAEATASDDGNAKVVARFSECMAQSGWRVGTPKPTTPPTTVAQNPPTGILPSAPPALSAKTTAPGAVVTPTPPAAAAVVAPVTPAPIVTPNAPARYQPARNYGEDAAPYGSGAGRQF